MPEIKRDQRHALPRPAQSLSRFSAARWQRANLPEARNPSAFKQHKQDFHGTQCSDNSLRTNRSSQRKDEIEFKPPQRKLRYIKSSAGAQPTDGKHYQMQMAVVGRYFVFAVFLQPWIIPKLVFSQQRCLGGFDIYFILDK